MSSGAITGPAPQSKGREPEQLLAAAKSGDKAAIGKLLSMVERGGELARRVGAIAFPASASVEQVIGITGAPGAGKSTLTDGLISAVRATGECVGVLAVDPTSPYSGGAILGDRIRMQGHVLDQGVFVRSMATRGHVGGLTLAAPEAIRVLAAVGIPVVFVETVGVGQVEVEVAGATDTTVVVLTPGWGDSIQTSKAGLLEAADVFVINKADRDGASEARRDLESMLDLSPEKRGWRPPILLTIASIREGVDELWATCLEHRSYLGSSGELAIRRDRRLVDELGRVLVSMLERGVRRLESGDTFERVKSEMLARHVDPYAAAAQLLST